MNVLLDAGMKLDIFEAAAVGATQRVAELLDGDASAIGAWSMDGYTPLHLAAFFGHVDAVRLLLERGAEPMAVSRNRMEVMPLHSAMAGADAPARRRVAELLLDHGAEIDARSHGGFTALMEATQNGDLQTADLLLARGADPTLRSDQGKSAQDLATAGGHTAVADRLRNRG
jgi:ankyrin repeat protein